MERWLGIHVRSSSADEREEESNAQAKEKSLTDDSFERRDSSVDFVETFEFS